MMRNLCLTIFALPLLCFGCEGQQLTPPPPDLSASSPGNPVGAVLVVAKPDDYQPTDDEDQRYRDFQTRAALHRAVREAVAHSDGWTEADGAVRTVLQEHPNVPSYEKEQVAALLMLQQHLLIGNNDPSTKRLEAIARYTDQLARHGNPNSMLIDDALTVLDGHWTSDTIRDAAASAFSAAERYIAARTDCDGCSFDVARRRITEDTRNAAVSASMDVAMEQAILGAERLRARL
jgi:hypothetical protein